MKEKYINIPTILNRICNDDDQIAFRQLFDLFYPRLLHFSYSFIRSSVLAEEIVLDVFSTIWQKRAMLNEVNDIENYLYTATKNRTLNAVRDRKKDFFKLEMDSIETAHIRTNHNPESELVCKELYEQINIAIESLPEKGLLIYRMVKEDDMNYKKVAELLDISPKTVDNHMYASIKKIRNVIELYYADGSQEVEGLRIS